jgi:Raf kinase inhibitor-like YbhB/YbcL family protein
MLTARNEPQMIRTLCLSATSLLTIATASAQEVGKFSNVQITGHVIEPKKVDATDERIDGLKVPAGFKVSVFARDVVNPRMLAVSDDGTVYATRRKLGDVIALKDTNGDGTADERKIVAQRPQMHGIAIHGDKVYLTTVKDVLVGDIKSDGSFGELDRIIDDLPDAGQHPNRTLTIGPDGMLYISVGSTCNACAESGPESATMLKAKPDGSSRTIFASGLRNTIGFGFHPDTKALWGMDHGIDWLGDNEQSEELNLIVEGKKYGWPYIYADSKLNPQDDPPGGISLEEWAKTSEEPTLLYTAHSAPMQMVFYEGAQFPAEFKGDAFVAMRGSWNRNPPSGYEVLRVDFENGKPVKFEPFLSGFMSSEGGKFEQFARLAGVAVAKDGALLVADDDSGIIYRVAYDQATASAEATGRAATTEPDRIQSATASGGTTQTGKQPTDPDLAKAILKTGDMPKIDLKSSAFGDGDTIPLRYGEDGEKLSPPLSWSNVPAGTKSLAVMMEDPDVPDIKPFVHWTIVNLPATDTALREGVPGDPKLEVPHGVIQGATSRGSPGYMGPKPPVGDPPHHYHFQIFALDTVLTVAPGAGRKELLDAMSGHVIGFGELVGFFERAPEAQAKGDPLVLPDSKQPQK